MFSTRGKIMRLFTTGNVLKITGLPANTFDAWCAGGHVKPFNDVAGTGNHRQFSLMQVLGIVIAVELRNQERSCVLSYVASVVDAFSKLPEEDLLKRFKKGVTHLMVVYNGTIVMDGPLDGSMVDVQSCYKAVSTFGTAKTKRPQGAMKS